MPPTPQPHSLSDAFHDLIDCGIDRLVPPPTAATAVPPDPPAPRHTGAGPPSRQETPTMTTTPCPGCRSPKGQGKYLCRTCWCALPTDTRSALNRRDRTAFLRVRELHQALDAGTPLADIKVTPVTARPARSAHTQENPLSLQHDPQNDQPLPKPASAPLCADCGGPHASKDCEASWIATQLSWADHVDAVLKRVDVALREDAGDHAAALRVVTAMRRRERARRRGAGQTPAPQRCENCDHAAHGHAEHLTDPTALRDCPNCPCASELRN